MRKCRRLAAFFCVWTLLLQLSSPSLWAAPGKDYPELAFDKGEVIFTVRPNPLLWDRSEQVGFTLGGADVAELLELADVTELTIEAESSDSDFIVTVRHDSMALESDTITGTLDVSIHPDTAHDLVAEGVGGLYNINITLKVFLSAQDAQSEEDPVITADAELTIEAEFLDFAAVTFSLSPGSSELTASVEGKISSANIPVVIENISDADNRIVNFTVSSENANIHCEPPSNSGGGWTFDVAVDEHTLAASQTVTVTVDALNGDGAVLCRQDFILTLRIPISPTITLGESVVYFRQGDTGTTLTYSVPITVGDPDGLIVSYELTCTGGSIVTYNLDDSGAPSALIITAVEPLITGEATITVTAKGDGGASWTTAEDTVAVTILGALSGPVVILTVTPPVMVYTDMPAVEVPFTVADSNGGNLLPGETIIISDVTAACEPVGAVELRIDDNEDGDGYILTLTPGATAVGSVTVTVNAANSAGLSGETDFTFSLLDAAREPNISFGDGSQTTAEDTPLTLDLAGFITNYDAVSSQDGAPQYDYTLSLPAEGRELRGGTAILDTDGVSLIFTPAENYYGPEADVPTVKIPVTLHYTKFGLEKTATAVLEIYVSPVEDVPVAAVDAFYCIADCVAYEIPITELLKNDSTVELDGVEFVSLNGSSVVHNPNNSYAGTLTLSGDGTKLIYRPNIRYEGTVTAQYTIKNTAGQAAEDAGLVCAETAVGTLSIEVTRGDNRLPMIELPTEDYRITVEEDEYVTAQSPFSFTILVTDEDVLDWSEVEISLTSDNEKILPESGVTLEALGGNDADERGFKVSLVFAPDAFSGNRYGQLELTLTVTDDQNGVGRVTIPVTVEPVNDAPDLRVLGDSVIGGALSFSGGVWTLIMDEDTTASFKVEVTDKDIPLKADGSADLGGYALDILGFSDTEKAVFAENGMTISAPAIDENKIKLSYTVIFTPKKDANTHQGAFSEEKISFTLKAADDGGAESGEAGFELDVRQVNDNPVAASYTYNIRKNETHTWDVLENCTDVDEDMLTITEVTAPAKGTAEIVTVTLEGGEIMQIKYVPAHNATGQDSFQYTVSDGNGGSATATVTVNIAYINYAPELWADDSKAPLKGQDDPYIMREDQTGFTIPLYVEDDEYDADSITVGAVLTGSNAGLIGDVDVLTDGIDASRRTLLFTPAANRNSYKDGAESNLVQVTITASDNNSLRTQAIYINVEPVNDAPAASNLPSQYTYEQGSMDGRSLVDSDILRHCSDVDAVAGVTYEGDEISLAGLVFDQGNATETTNPDGTVTLSHESQGTLTITKNSDGSIAGFTYIPPDIYFKGDVPLRYTISDTQGETAGAVLTLKAVTKNYAPLVTELTETDITIWEDTAYEFDLLFIDPETDRDNLVISIGSSNENVINREGLGYTVFDGISDTPVNYTGGAHMTITPRPNQFCADGGNGPESIDITITVSDRINSVTTGLTITILPLPDRPEVPAQEVETREATTTGFNLLEECMDVDPDDILKLVAVTFLGGEDSDGTSYSPDSGALPASLGVLTFNEASGLCEFTPEDGFVGELTFSYTVRDSYHGEDYPTVPTGAPTDNYTGGKYAGEVSGILTIIVLDDSTGPSLKRLQPIVAYAGQDLPAYTLETKTLTSGLTYSFRVEVSGASVDAGSVKIDGQYAGSGWSYTANGDDPTHSISFNLKSGVIGKSVVRVILISTDGAGAVTENAMSFTVTTHADNIAPTMLHEVTIPAEDAENERTGTGYNSFVIDVLDLAEAYDLEGEAIRFGAFSLDNATASGGDTVEVFTDTDGRQKIRYTVRYERNVNNNDENGVQYVALTYSIFDAGGKEGEAVDASGDKYPNADSPSQTAVINIPIRVENHNPNNWGFIRILDDITDYNSTYTLNRSFWHGSTGDADGDARYITAVQSGTDDSSNAYFTDLTHDGDTISFTPPAAGGWVTLQYRVVSYPGILTSHNLSAADAAQKASDDGISTMYASGFATITLYIPPEGTGGGLIPPKIGTGSWTRDSEDATGTVSSARPSGSVGPNPDANTREIDISGIMYGDGGAGINAYLEFVGEPAISGSHAARAAHVIENVRVERRDLGTVPGTYRYYLIYDLLPDGNTYLDANGDMTGSESGITVNFTLKNAREPGNITASGNYTIYVAPVNDKPVIHEDGFAVTHHDGTNLAVTTADESGRTVIESIMTVEKDATNTIQFRVTDPDFKTQDKCDDQITISASSGNNIAVVSNAIKTIEPSDEPGVWTVEFSGYLVGDTVITLRAYDAAGEESETYARITVHVVGGNEAPSAKDHYAVYNEEQQVSVKVAYQDIDNQSDPDGDPVEIVLATGDPGNSYADYGTVKAVGDRIIFIPKQDICHAATWPLNTGTTEIPDSWNDSEEIRIAFRIREDTGRDTLLESGVRYLYIHINPVNDAPSFVGIGQTNEIKEVSNAQTPQYITLTLRDVDSDLAAAFDANRGSFYCSFGSDLTGVFMSDAAEIISVIKTVGVNTYQMAVRLIPKAYTSHATGQYSELTVTMVDGDGGATVGVLKVHVSDSNFAPELIGSIPQTDGENQITVLYNDPNTWLITNEDTAITIPLTEYFTDPDGDSIRLSTCTGAQNGSITISGDGNSVIFTPSKDYFTKKEYANPALGENLSRWGGFRFAITDGAASVSGTLYLFIRPVNDQPVTNNLTFSVGEDRSLDIELITAAAGTTKVSDADNPAVELSIVAAGTGSALGVTGSGFTEQGGTVEIITTGANAWSLLYTPRADFFGSDSFYYTVTDTGNDPLDYLNGNGEYTAPASGTGRITINVSGEDDPPRANFEGSDSWGAWFGNKDTGLILDQADINAWAMNEDTVQSFRFAAWDAEGKSVTVESGFTLDTGVPTNCNSVSDLFDSATGAVPSGSGMNREFTFTPKKDAYGGATLKVTLSDGTKTTEYSIPVYVEPVNDAPTITGTQLTINEDNASASITINATDVETAFANLSFELDESQSEQPARGTVTIDSGTGSFIYTPTADYFGEDCFWIKVTDRGATDSGDSPLSATARYSVNITPVNDAPTAPSQVTLDKSQYNGTESVVVTWSIGGDKFNETKDGDIKYEIAYSFDGVIFQSVGPVSGDAASGTGNENLRSYNLGNITAGENTDNLTVQIRTADDGKSYDHAGAAADDNVAQTGTVLFSAWVSSGASRVDSTAPSVSFEQTPDSWTNGQITIEVKPAPGSIAGYTQIAKVEALEDGGDLELQAVGGKYFYTVSDNGTYNFRITDAAGNTCTASETVTFIDRVNPIAVADTVPAAGYAMGDEPHFVISVTDPAEKSDITYPTDGHSGVKTVEIQLLDNGGNPADDAWENHTTGERILIPTRGTYTLHVRSTDNAGNVNVQSFGPCTVVNTLPVPGADQSVTLYEKAVSGNGVTGPVGDTVTFTASDIDNDALVFSLEQNAAYNKLLEYATVAMTVEGAVSLNHRGGEVPPADAVIVLTVQIFDGLGISTATLTVNLIRVNDAPGDPSDFLITEATSKDHYRSSASIDLNWTQSADMETSQNGITYELQYQIDSGSWQPLPDVTGLGEATTAIPAITGGGTVSYQIRANDKNVSDVNPDGTTAPRYSDWVLLGPLKIDNTPPTATHIIVQDSGDIEYAFITISATDGSEDWQSGLYEIVPPNGMDVVFLGNGQFRVKADTDYIFQLVDNAGNTHGYTVKATAPEDPVIAYALDPVRIGREINVTWNHDSNGLTGIKYTLQYSTDGTNWITVSDSLTVKSYKFTVPLGTPDTEQLQFRVNARDDKNLQSPGWSVGVEILCDSTPPVINFTADKTMYTNTDVHVTCNVTDDLSGLAPLTENMTASQTIVAGTYPTSFTTVYTFTENGTVTVTATDLCGNETTESFLVDNIDKQYPVVTISAISNTSPIFAGEEATNPIRFTLNFSDTGVSQIKSMNYAITDSAVRPASGDFLSAQSASVNLTEQEIAEYYVHLYAEDHAGNIFYSCEGPYKIVNTAPIAKDQTVTVNEGGAIFIQLAGSDRDYADSVVDFRLTDSPAYPEQGDLVQLSAGNGDPITGRYSYTHDGTQVQNGTEEQTGFKFVAVDSYGVESLEATVTIKILPRNDAPEIEPNQHSNWNTETSRSFTFDVSDADDPFGDLSIAFRSSNEAILPSAGIRLSKIRDNLDSSKGEAELTITPKLGAVDRDTTVTVTVTVRDPAGLTDTATLTLGFISQPLPPTAENQYFYLKANGTVAGEVGAGLGRKGVSLTYHFDEDALEHGIFSGDSVDGSFSYTADAQFSENDNDKVTVTITQTNVSGLPDTVCTAILLFCGEVRTSEADINDVAVRIIPGITQPVAGTDYTITSSQPDIISAGECSVEYFDGALALKYMRNPYMYGELVITLDDGQGNQIELPFVVEPINNAPDAILTATPVSSLMSLMSKTVTLPTSGNSVTLDEHSQQVSVALTSGKSLTGTLDASDGNDDQSGKSETSKYDDSYECKAFSYTIHNEPLHGKLSLIYDSGIYRYSYIPDAGYLGEDQFSFLIGEDTGFSDNQNPAALPEGVLDLSDAEPKLGRIVTVVVTIAKEGTLPGAGSSDPSENAEESIFDEFHYAYIIGYPDGTIRPDGSLSRAEAATVFFRLLKDEVRSANWTQSNSYVDVNHGDWHNNAVSVMSAMSVLTGYPDGSFRPGDPITRGELAAIAARFGKAQGNESIRGGGFTDIDGHWASEDILYATGIGWLTGYPDGTFRPDTSITRAELMTLVNRMTGRSPQTAEDLLEGMLTWSDNMDTSAWYYLDVQEATNSHEHERKDDVSPDLGSLYERWVIIAEPRDWTDLERRSW